jgi:hypothetical protein
MLITTMTTPAIQDLIKKSFITTISGGQPDTVREVFMPETSDFTVDRKRIQEMDRERFAERKGQGQGSAQRGIAQGYNKEIVRSTISITRKVAGEEYLALEAHKLSEYAMNVAKDLVDKIELDMRNYLGYATGATSYVDNGGYTIDLTVGDGLSVFSTAHTLKNSATTYSNILSGAPTLTNTALESAEDFFSYNVLDNYGQRMSIKPNTIITSRKAIMVNRVARILRSESPEAISGTANANAGVFNTYKNKYRHLVIEFDVDQFNVTNSSLSYYWFLAALGGQPEDSFQAYYVRWLSPTVAPAEVDQDKWILSFTGRACYGIAAVSGRGILVAKATS